MKKISKVLATGLSAIVLANPIVYGKIHENLKPIVETYKLSKTFTDIDLKKWEDESDDDVIIAEMAHKIVEEAKKKNPSLTTSNEVEVAMFLRSLLKNPEFNSGKFNKLLEENTKKLLIRKVVGEMTKFLNSGLKIMLATLPLSVAMWGIENFLKSGTHLQDFILSAKSMFNSAQIVKGITAELLTEKLPEIQENLENSLAGQDEAIEKIMCKLKEHCAYLQECKDLKIAPSRCLVLHFYGAPGTGKSTALKVIANTLGVGTYTSGMAQAVEDKGNSANTVISRLMKDEVLDNGRTKQFLKTQLRKVVESPYAQIISFDEIEKQRLLDSQLSKRDFRTEKGFIIPSTLDEAMRDAKDQAKFAGISVGNKIFITISNETEEDLNQLEPSFKDRLSGGMVYFKDFNIDDYKDMIIKSSKDLFEAYKKRGFNLSWSENALDYYSKLFAEHKYSGRRVVEFIDEIRAKIKNYESELIDCDNWLLNYNKISKEFEVIENNIEEFDPYKQIEFNENSKLEIIKTKNTMTR